MGQHSRSMNFENINAVGDISIVNIVYEQHGRDTENKLSEALLEKIKPLLHDTKKEIADQVTRNLKGSVEDIQNEVFVRNDDVSRTADAYSKVVWAAVEDDRIAEFELEPHLRNLAEFFARKRTFFSEYVRSGKQLTLRKLPNILREFDKSLGSDEEFDQLQYIRGVVFFLGFQYAKALRELDPIARRSAGSPAISMLVAESALNIGQFSVALRHFERALSSNLDFEDRGDLRRALLLNNAGACHEELMESEAAIGKYRAALALLNAEECDTNANLVKALVINNLGFSLMTIANESALGSNLETAEQLFLEALQLREESEDTDANLASVMFNLAEVKRKLGQPGDSALWIDRAEGRMSSFPRPHILHASIWNAKGRSLFERGEYRESVDFFRKARATLEANFGERSLKVAYTTYSIAQALEALSDPDAASTLLLARSLALTAIEDVQHPFIRMLDEDIKNPPRASD